MDEYDIIDLLTKTAGRLPAGYSPIGDDVATLPSSPGRLVLKADMLVGQDRRAARDDLEAGGPEGRGDVR